MAYVDSFVLAVPKADLDNFRVFTRKAGEVWREHGACAYVACVGEDAPAGELMTVPHAVPTSDDEVIVFSWIVYDSREHCETVTAKALADPRLQGHGAGPWLDGRRLIEAALHNRVQV